MRGEGPELVLQTWEALKVLGQSPGNTGQSSPSQSHVGPSPRHSTFCFSGRTCAVWAGPPLAPEGAQSAGPQAALLQSRGPGAPFKLAGREGGATAGGGGEPVCQVGWALSQPGALLCSLAASAACWPGLLRSSSVSGTRQAEAPFHGVPWVLWGISEPHRTCLLPSCLGPSPSSAPRCPRAVGRAVGEQQTECVTYPRRTPGLLRSARSPVRGQWTQDPCPAGPTEYTWGSWGPARSCGPGTHISAGSPRSGRSLLLPAARIPSLEPLPEPPPVPPAAAPFLSVCWEPLVSGRGPVSPHSSPAASCEGCQVDAAPAPLASG